MNPRVFKKEGLKHLDRVIDLVCSVVCLQESGFSSGNYDAKKANTSAPSTVSTLSLICTQLQEVGSLVQDS
jgi:hypothetical protein